MPKPKKDKEKKTSGAGGWDWSSFATEPSTPAKTANQPQQPQNKGAGWDWSTLPTNQADETRRQQREQEQRQAGQRAAARYAAQDRVISAGRYAADAMRGGLRAIGIGRDSDDLGIQSDRYQRDYQRYTEMARDARQYHDASLLSMAQNGLRQSGDAYNDSYQRYMEAQQQAKDKRNQELKETNKAQWYGENLSREQIEGQIRQLEQRKAANARSAELATEAAKNDPHRAEVYSSQAGDGREPWYTRALWNADRQSDEIDAEIMRYQAALRYRESMDRDAEMAEMARSISSASNFQQMSEIGRDMVEKRNKSARASVNGADYLPDDPDNNRQFARAERQEREALTAAGYVGDLDSSYIPEEIKPVYYALFAQSPAKAKAFAEYWAEKGEQARWNELYEKSGEDAATRARAFIEGTFANTVAGLAPFEEGGQYAAKLGKTMIGGGAAGLTEKGLFNTGFGAGTYHSDLFGDISLGSAYQLGSSMLQSAANATLAKMTGGAAALVGGAGTILLGSSAAAQDYQEKIEQGWDENSAKLHALAAGTAESLFEYVSLDKLIDQDVTRGFLRNILTQGGVEASEEALTTISNRITDAVISEATGNKNQIEAKTRELVEKGYELGTAEKMAQQEWLTELMSDALGGFLSGGLMSSGQYAMQPVYKVMDAVETNRYNERTGALSSRTGEAAALAQYAADNNLEWASPEQSTKPVKTGAGGTETNLNESTLGQQVAEAAEKNKSRQELRQERKANRQTGADVNRARSHIREQLAGKTVQEQQTVRDELIQKYGEAIAPTVSRAITMEAAKQAAQLDSTDAIRQAREAALAEISDENMKRAVADGYDQAAYAKINQSGNAYEADRYIQQLRTTGTGTMSMEATVSAQDGQSRKVSITGMTEDGKGVKLADGTTVAVKSLQADADTLDVIQQMADLDMGQDADAVFQAYQKSSVAGTEGYRWLMNYATAYNQGRANSVSLEEAVARSSLDDRAVLEAYTLGQRSAHRETQQGLERLEKLPKRKGVTGKTSKIDTDEIKGKTMNDSERQQFDYANRIVSALGVNLTWFSSEADDKGRYIGKNGAYENGTIYMDIHAGRNFESDMHSGILATMSHELSHFQQQYAPREYQKLKQFLFRQIAQNSKGGEDALERLIWEKQRRSGNKLSRRQAEGEVVADACQKMIRDSKAIHEFAREHESAVAGMVRWLKDWFKKLRAIFNRSATFSQEAELMDKLEADVKKAFGELWDKGITEAVRVHDQVGDIEGDQAQHSDRDTEYLELAKDPEKNQERLQEMVEEAALAWGARTEEGKPKAFYHSTNAKFTTFKKGHGMLGEGIYFSTYGQNFYGKNQIKVYLKYENPINFRDVPLEGKERSSAGIPMGIVDNFYDMFPEYDAIISRDEELTVKSPSQVKSAEPVTYDDDGNVIPLSERFNTENPDIRFSLRDPVEQTDRLIALHNLSAEKLSKALALGGFPMPSIAVTKTNIPHTNFGPITLVMDKSTIDPMQDRRNTVYSADAWTPTFPSVEYEVNEKAASRLRKKYFEIMEKYGKDAADPLYPWANYAEDELNRKGGPEEILDRYRKDPDMMKIYLVDNGLNVPATVTEETVERMDESTVKFYDTFVQEMGKDVFEELMVRKGETAQDVRKRWYAEHGDDFEAAYRKYMQSMGFSEEEISNVLNNETISSLTRQAINIRNYLRTGTEKKTVTTNVTATNNAIRAAVDSEKYDAWLRDLFDGIVKSQGIYNGKDRFTPSGNERSFAATHYSVTLENIAKAMAAQNDGNSRNVSGFHGVKSLRAGTAKRFSSIAEMHKYEGRLQHLTEEQAEKINEALSDRLANVMGQIYDSKPHGKYDNSFIGMDAIGENLMEITEQKNITNASIQRIFSKYGYQISDALAGEVRALLFDISQMPVNIYEAKPERAVRFDEVLAAIVPTDTDKALLEKLRDAGVQNLIEYAAGDDTDRLAKVNSVEGAQFSERDYSLPSDLELMDRAAESLSEAGGEEYWNALLESAPELADDREELRELMKANRAAARKLAETEAKLEEARRQMKPGGSRKLNTRGIATVAQNIMKDLHAGDAKNRGVARGVTQILTDAYQKGLDAIDAGKDPGEVWDIVFNEGVMKATDYLLQNATYAEKHGRGWITTNLGAYMPGEDGRFAVMDAVSARVVMDWGENRVREAMQATIADRLIERTENRMQKQIDAATERATTAEQSNKKLSEDLDFWKSAQDKAAKQVTFLDERLKEARDDLKTNRSASAKERKAAAAKAEALANRLTAKRREAAAWKRLAEQNESLLRAALKSKNADLEAQSKRADTAEAALAGQTVNARAWERNADLYAKQLDKTLEQKAKIVKQLEAQVKREKKILAGTLTPPAMQRLLKAAREDARKKAETHKDEVFQNYKERKNKTAIRNRIKNLHAEMQRDLLKPREGHFVPEALIRPVVELLDMVNTQTNRAKSENAQAKIDAINAQYDKLKNDERYSQYYDETVKALLVELSSTLNGRSIYQLNSDELADVYTAMKAMRTTIRNAIKADLVEKGKEIWEIGNELRQELRQGKGAHAYLLEKYHMSMLNAQRAFNRFGGYRQGSTWNKVYRMLDNAQLDMLRIEMEATRIFDPVLKAKADFERAQNLTSLKKGALVDVGLRDENGRSVWITRGMMLSLYMHLQNEQNMKHLMYGGLTLPDFKRYYDGNPEAWGRGTVEIPALGARVSNLEQLLEEQGEEWVRSQYKTMEEDIKKMFESVRESIEKQMTDYDRKWIAASKEFFDDFSRRELNRVTNSMYGFSKAKVDNYFPIVTDSNFLKSEFDSISRNVSLENAGFMKERVKASNPILLEDITRTVNRQISNVSRYAGLTEALKQFGNIYNVQTKGFTDSVKKAMAKSYGKTGQEYIQNLITDMVGGRSTPGTIFDRIKGNYAQAVLSANLSVTIKQAASYPTAAAVIGWKPLAKALAKGGRNNRVFSRADRALIDTYSPLLWKRSQGAIDTEIGDMAHAQDWTKKAKWLMGWIEKTDIATVGRLWYAAEYYVQDNFKGLEKGTAEQIRNGESPFYQKVAEIFNRIVEETQPNYTVLQRPDILRNPNKLLRSLVMFSTQRFQNGQILIDAVAEYGAMRSLDRKGSTEETKAARQEAKRKLTWAITSQAVSAVVLNAMTLLAGAIMHRMNPWRDDDDEITLESTAGALLDGWMESLAGSFLGGSEIYEALDSLLTGSTYYGNDVGGLSSINDFASALITMGQKAVKLVGDESSKPEDWGNLAKNQLWKVGEYLSQMTGVPVANVRKIIEGGVQHVQDAMETHIFSFEAGLARSNTANARRYAEAWEAGDGAKMKAVIDEMNRNLEKAGKSIDGARDAITKAAKERYEAGEIELNQYADFLRRAGYLEEDKIESKIRDFLRDELATGDRTEEEVLRLLPELGGLTEDKAWKKVMEWKAKAETGQDEDEAAKYSEYNALREDLRSGASFQEAAADYLAHGYTEKQVRDAAKDGLKARFQAGELSEDKAIDLLVEYSGKDEDACWNTVQGWQGAMEHPEDEDYSWGQYDAIDEALAGNKDIKALVSELTAHGVKEKNINDHVKEQLVQNYVDGRTNETQLKNQLSRYLGIVVKADVDKILKDANSKKLYGVEYGKLDEAYRSGSLSKTEIKTALMKQGGLSFGEADQKIRWYDLQKANPKLEISEAVCNAWYDGTTNGSQKYGRESARSAGMSIERYVEARKYLDTIKDNNGNGTGEDEVIRALAGMSGLTSREKDALYYERYKGGARKGIYKTW